MKLRGKEGCDPGFILRYFEAFDLMLKTGKPQPIQGYAGWKVSRPKEDVE